MVQLTGADITIDLPASVPPYQGTVSTACPSTAGCVSVPLASVANTNQWNLLGYAGDTPLTFGQTRVAAASGACSAGCTPDQALANDVMHNQLWRYDGTAYELINSATTMQAWNGFWAAALPEAHGRSAQWLVPQPAPPVGSDADIDAAPLLTQATFGPTIPAIEQVINDGGPAAWVDAQLALPANYHLPIVKHLFPNGWDTQQGRYRAFWDQSIQADDQLRQRVAFALSEIMVISSVPDALINHGNLVAAYYDLLVEHAFGNYRDLLEAVTLSPAMGIYLSMLGNEKPDASTGRRADENYAREVMQLFSIGLVQLNSNGSIRHGAGGIPIPTYQQSDVENLARVFTGWSWDRPDWQVSPIDGWYPELSRMERPMKSFAGHHDTDAKQFLNTSLPAGRTAQQDLSSAMNTLFNHANVGPFISKQLIQRLVTSNPSPAYVARITTVFNDNGQRVRGDLAAVSKAIVLDSEARSASTAGGNTYGKLREPLLRFSHLLRAFAVQDPVLLSSGYYISQYAALTANSVFNFFSPAYSPAGAIQDAGLVAPEFQINSEARINRVNDALMAVTQDESFFGLFPAQMNLATERALLATPVQLIDRLDLLLLSGSMSNGLRQALLGYISTNQDEVDSERLLRDVIALVMTSAEYAIQR